MYAAADEIRKKLLGRTREEIRKDAIKKQSHVDEKEVDVMVENERRILNEVFSQQKVNVRTLLKLAFTLYVSRGHCRATRRIHSAK